MKEKSTRSKGDELENYVLVRIASLKKTNNSGAVSANGDLIDSEIMIDCKNIQSKSTVSISDSELTKIKTQSGRYNKDWALVHKTSTGKIVACVDFEFFQVLYNTYFEQINRASD